MLMKYKSHFSDSDSIAGFLCFFAIHFENDFGENYFQRIPVKV